MSIDRVEFLTKMLTDLHRARAQLLCAPGYDAKHKADLVVHMSKTMVLCKRALRRECEIPDTDK